MNTILNIFAEHEEMNTMNINTTHPLLVKCLMGLCVCVCAYCDEVKVQ